MEVPRLGVGSELLPLVYTTATAIWGSEPNLQTTPQLTATPDWVRPGIEHTSSWVLDLFPRHHGITVGTPTVKFLRKIFFKKGCTCEYSHVEISHMAVPCCREAEKLLKLHAAKIWCSITTGRCRDTWEWGEQGKLADHIKDVCKRDVFENWDGTGSREGKEVCTIVSNSPAFLESCFSSSDLSQPWLWYVFLSLS